MTQTMSELTDAQLDELERLAETATPGNWRVRRIEGYCDNQIETDHPDFVARKPWGHVVAEVGLCAGDKDTSKFERDSEFIAAADPPTVLALVREVRRLRAAIGMQDESLLRELRAEIERRSGETAELAREVRENINRGARLSDHRFKP